MKVNFYATLRTVVGAKAVDFPLPEGATIREVLAEMVRSYPPLQHELFDDQGNLYRHVNIFINGRDVTFLAQGLDTPLPADATLGVFPAVGGGD